MRTSIESNHSRKIACGNDGRKLQKRRLCPHDSRQSRSENPIKKEDLCACLIWIKIILPAQLKMSIYSREILAIDMAFLEFAQILWEAAKPTTVLTDNTRVFQTKAFPPSLWNACDYVLQFNFKIAHTAGSVNTAAEFLSQSELKVMERIRRKIREDVQAASIEVTTSS